MAKINVDVVASESKGENFEEFVGKFQENITNLTARQKYEDIQSDREYELDIDGYIVGDVWSESIASEIMDINGFQATAERIDTLIEGRAFYDKATLPNTHQLIAKDLQLEESIFLKMFPKFPVIYFTRWGNMRKPSNLQELRDNPVRR